MAKNTEGFGHVGLPSRGVLQLPGISYKSSEMTQTLLQENHDRYHWSFTEGGLHNHLSHHVLAVYSLGAPSETIKAAFDLRATVQRPMPSLMKEINDDNLNDLLGQDDAYASYLRFFSSKIESMGMPAVLERYLFTHNGSNLLVRLVSGAIHPFIQCGHGIEFGIPALAAEGLAQAAVHSAMALPLFEDDFVDKSKVSNGGQYPAIKSTYTGDRAPENFTSTARAFSRTGTRRPRKGLSGFTILSRIFNDPGLAAGKVNALSDGSKFKAAVNNGGERIREWCQLWVIDPDGGFEEIVAKTEEIIWMATVIYASASRPGFSPAKLDFFTLHGVTASIFLPNFVEVLTPSSRIKLLEAYFRVLVAYWISRGRPELHVENTLLAATDNPLPPIDAHNVPGCAITRETSNRKQSQSNESSGPAETSPDSKLPITADPVNPNPWARIITSVCDHHDEHLVKVVRTFLYADALFGQSPPGYYKSELAGTDRMDGSIFIRAAGISLDTIGWAHEGHYPGAKWDRSGLGFPESWQAKDAT